MKGARFFQKTSILPFIKPKQLPRFRRGSISPEALSEASLRAMVLVEKAKISQALRQAKWNKTKTAEALNVGYKTLLSKIKEYGLEEE